MPTRFRRGIVAAVLLLAAAPHTLIACASKPATTTPPPDPSTWVAIPCRTCSNAGLKVETRRSIDDRGRAGRYVYARVSNLNAHAVTFSLDLVAEGPPSGDPDILSKQWRLTLMPGPDSGSTTLLMADYSPIATANVFGVERF